MLRRAQLDMDFIYGKTVNATKTSPAIFYPLDGQQRLTTLFLLYWYLSMKAKKRNLFYNAFYDTTFDQPKFRYETRQSSTKFCEKIISCNLEKEVSSLTSTDKISDLIHDQSWYKSSWQHDPTSEGMLNMLDEIHKYYQELFPNKANYLLRNLHCLSFQVLFLNNKNFTLSDDLYIKMNSRGRPLTDFETFKAKFGQFIKDLGRGWGKYSQQFHQKLDHEWIDCFWTNFRRQVNSIGQPIVEDNVDQQLMSFIKLIISGEFVASILDYEQKDWIDVIDILFETQKAKDRNEDLRMTFFRYNELNILCNSQRQLFDYKVSRNCIRAFDLLTLLCGASCSNYEPEFPTDIIGNYPLSYTWKPLQVDDEGYSQLTFAERLYLYSYLTYIINGSLQGQKLINEIQNGNSTAIAMLKSWTRFMRNIIESHTFNDVREAHRGFAIMSQILHYMKENHLYDITELLATKGLPNQLSKLADYNEQLNEEELKAKIIYYGSSSYNWKKEIHDIEDNNYLKGRIGFLLIISGLDSVSFTNVKGCGFSNESIISQKFLLYKKKAVALLNVLSNLSRTPQNYANHDFVLERALLTKELYGRIISYPLKGRMINLSNFYSDSNSWRSLALFDSSNLRSFTIAIKDIFDDPAYNINNVIASLKTIIKNYLSQSTHHWWKPIIEDVSLLQESQNSNIWVRDVPGQEIMYIISKQTFSSWHIEIFTQYYYHNNITKGTYTFKLPEYLKSDSYETVPGMFVKFKNPNNVIYYLYMKARNSSECEISIVNEEKMGIVTDPSETSHLLQAFNTIFLNNKLTIIIPFNNITQVLSDFTNCMNSQSYFKF